MHYFTFKIYKNNINLYSRFNLSEYRWKFTSKCYFLRNFKKFRIWCSNIKNLMLFYPTQLRISRDTFFEEEVFIRSDFRIVTLPPKKIFPKDSDIQRNRKFGYGRECFAPPSPYLWGCSKFEKSGSTKIETYSLVSSSNKKIKQIFLI